MVANLSCGKLKRKSDLSPFVPENFISREGFGRPAPRQHLRILHAGSEAGAYSRDFSCFPRRCYIIIIIIMIIIMIIISINTVVD